MDQVNRRNFLLFSAAAFIGGCQETRNASMLPAVDWPSVGVRPATSSGSYVPNTPSRSPAQSPVAVGGIHVHPRAEWSNNPHPVRGRSINAMGPIRRITVHHEGWKAVTFSDVASTMERLNQIRQSHVGGRGWSDIGYHFIVDRAGRVWEGRSLRYQGAHVRDHNEHNVGVMVLGNFDIQSPSSAQLRGLRETVRGLRQANKVAEHNIFTHQEISPTACPGKHLQPRVAQMRAAHAFA